MRYVRANSWAIIPMLVAGRLSGQGVSADAAMQATPAAVLVLDSTALPLSAWRGLRQELLSSSPPIRVVLGAGVDQWQDAPNAWHPTLRGFGQRSGVRLAEVGAQLTVLYGTAALLGQDPTYRPRHHGSWWTRAQHAVVGSVSAYRPDGSRVIAPGTITGAVASAVVAKQLLPATATRAEILSRGTSMLTNRVVRSLWIEFLSPPHPK